MKLYVLAAILLSLITLPALAQNEANNWYWGPGRAVQFLPVLKEVTTDNVHQSYEACASMSDRVTGKIAFYSDFLTTGGDNNVNLRNMMQDIISVPPLRGYSASSQGLLAVPDPADCFRYYVFSLDVKKSTALPELSKLTYSVLDFRDGIGRILSRENVVLEDYLSEGMTGTIQSNGRDFWLVVYRYTNPTFIAVSITKNGINSSNSVYSPAGTSKNDPVVPNGKIKLSPNGKKMASYLTSPGFGLSDFDNATGIVTNYKLYPTPVAFTFSPDNSKLYYLGIAPYQGNATLPAGRLYQIDFADPTLKANPVDTTQSIWYSFSSSIQIAPDGKIYFISSPGNGSSPVMNLSCIENPNAKGNACTLVTNKLRLKDYVPGKESIATQLPNYMDYIFNSTGVLGIDKLIIRCSQPRATAAPDSGCIGSPLTFTEQSAYATRRSWKFTGGTPGSSTDSVATVRYSKAGTYEVILTVENDNGIFSDTTKAIVFQDPTANAGADKTFCPNSSVVIGTAAEAGNTYQWQPATDLDNALSANPTVTPKVTTQYILTVTSPQGCIAHDTVLVSSGTIKAVVTRDTIICAGSALQLLASGGAQYKWSPVNGLSNASIENPIATPTITTTYTVVVSSGSCVDSSTVTITVLPSPTANAGRDTTICFGTSTVIGEVARGGLTYSWQPTAGLDNPTKSNPQASPSTTTQYILTAAGGNGCVAIDTVIVTIGNIKSVVTSDTSICPGSSVQLSASGGTMYSWLPVDGLSDPTSANPLASPIKTTTYRVLVSSGICSDSSLVTVTVTPPPLADAGVDKILCVTGSVQIGTLPVIGNFYAWSPVTGLSNSSIANPFASPVQTTQYILSVTNAAGCVKYDTVQVYNNPEVTREFSLNPDSVIILPSESFRQMIQIPEGAIDWKLRVRYNPFIAAFTSIGNVSSGITAAVLNDARGELSIGGSGNSGMVELLFKAYLPNTTDTTYTTQLVIDSVRMVPCESATTKGATLKLANYCARSIRIVSISSTSYSLKVKDRSIDFGVGLSGKVRLEVFDYVGNSIQVITDGQMEAGEYSTALDLPVGVYYCRMKAGMYESVAKVIIAR